MNDAAYAGERDVLLERIVESLKRDPAVVAAWLGGSLGRGNADDLSDLDLWIVVEDDRIDDIAANPAASVHAVVPTIMNIEAPANAPPSGAYLLTWIDGAFGPQQVDWYWQPVTGAVRPVNSRLLFEQRPMPPEPAPERFPPYELDRGLKDAVRDPLLMAFIAAKHARRGNPWTATAQLMHAASCLGRSEWLLDHGTLPRFDDRASVPLPNSMLLTSEEQRAWIRDALDRTLSRLEAERPGFPDAFDDAIRSVERWLEVGVVRTRSSPQSPTDTPPGDPPTPSGG